MSIQITDILELEDVFIILEIDTNMTLSKRGELKKSCCYLGRSNRQKSVRVSIGYV